MVSSAVGSRRLKSIPLVVNYKRPPLFSYQTKFLDGPERYTVIEGATKIGKTAPLIIWLFEQSLAGKAGQRFIWLAPIFAQAKIAFRRMIRQCKISRTNGKSFFKINKSELSLELPNKAVIVFRSADNPDSIFGEDYYAAVYDEASRGSKESFEALRSTLTSTGGKIKFIANVRGRGWYYELAQKAKNGGNPDYKHFKVTCWDAVCTGRLDAAEVIAAKSTLVDHKVFDKLLEYAISDTSLKSSPKHQRLTLKEILDAEFIMSENGFKEVFEAEPSDDGGNPFGLQNIEAAMQPGLSSLPAVCQGIDLASKKDYTVITGLDKDKRVCSFQRFQMDWPLTKTIVGKAKDIPTAIDGTGVGAPIVADLQQNKKHMESFIFTTQSKQRLMEGLVTAFQMGELIIPNEGPLVDELKSFEFNYNQKTGHIKYSAPTGLHDDCVMSLAMAWDKFRDQPKPVRPAQARVIQTRRGYTA